MANFGKDIKDVKLYFFKSGQEKEIAHDARILMERKYERQIVPDIASADVVVALGGDGTFLKAEHEIAETVTKPKKPSLLGIAYGTANNLMNRPDNLYSIIVNARSVDIHPLRLKYSQGNGIYRSQIAFNEIVAHRASLYNQTCHLDVQLGSIKGTTYSDGIVFATSQGDGGYNFQSGGKFIGIWSGEIGSHPLCDVKNKKLSRTIPDTTEITVNVDDFIKRPIILNADNNLAIQNVVRFTVKMDKGISVPVLWTDAAPIMQKNLEWLSQQNRGERIIRSHPLAIRRQFQYNRFMRQYA